MNHYLSGTEPPPATARRAASRQRGDRKARRVKTLVLTHVLAQIDRPEVREQIICEIQDEFDGNVIWGEDLMQLTLARSELVKIE
jgi:hypothetical protein